MLTLTVIIPVFNEQNTVLKVVEKVKAVPIIKEIIIVDDGSTDKTPILLESLRSDPDIRVISHHKNMGRGAGIRTALAVAQGYITIFQDADLETSPSHYPMLIQPILDDEADVVFGSRFLGKGLINGMGIHAYFANALLTQLTSILFKSKLTDVLTMFQVTTTERLRNLNIETDSWGSTIEITAKLLKKKYRIVEIPVDYIPRRKDTGKKVRWSDFFGCLGALIKYKFFYKA
ncbi:MAG: glycosyltransferase family 2 protein [Acidobacteriota bacterium]|nr:glycosyltransferase family 2 protein [Acidobacteriota bacterium]